MIIVRLPDNDRVWSLPFGKETTPPVLPDDSIGQCLTIVTTGIKTRHELAQQIRVGIGAIDLREQRRFACDLS